MAQQKRKVVRFAPIPSGVLPMLQEAFEPVLYGKPNQEVKRNTDLANILRGCRAGYPYST
jgi:hypothetical protein